MQGRGNLGQEGKRVGGPVKADLVKKRMVRNQGGNFFSKRISVYKKGEVAWGEIQERHHFKLCSAGLWAACGVTVPGRSSMVCTF